MAHCPLSLCSVNHRVISRKGCSQRVFTLALLKLFAVMLCDQARDHHSTGPTTCENETQWSLHWCDPMPRGDCLFLVALQGQNRTEMEFPAVGPMHQTGQCPDKEKWGHDRPGNQGSTPKCLGKDWTWLESCELQERCNWIFSSVQNLPRKFFT